MYTHNREYRSDDCNVTHFFLHIFRINFRIILPSVREIRILPMLSVIHNTENVVVAIHKFCMQIYNYISMEVSNGSVKLRDKVALGL